MKWRTFVVHRRYPHPYPAKVQHFDSVLDIVEEVSMSDRCVEELLSMLGIGTEVKHVRIGIDKVLALDMERLSDACREEVEDLLKRLRSIQSFLEFRLRDER